MRPSGIAAQSSPRRNLGACLEIERDASRQDPVPRVWTTARARLNRLAELSALLRPLGSRWPLTLHALPEALCLFVVSSCLALVPPCEGAQERSGAGPPVPDPGSEVVVLCD
jgi:hypothetical protein